jgi:cytochrome c-type biogenesis protein CcmE
MANKVIAKCPSKYEMQERQKNGEKMPHAMPAS